MKTSLANRVLVRLNRQIGEAELKRDEKFMREVLADELVFRRANGKIVTKDEYLSELMKPENSYELLRTENIKTAVTKENALVSLTVITKGKRGETEFEGEFQNVRVFVKRKNEWQCIVWFNARIK